MATRGLCNNPDIRKYYAITQQNESIPECCFLESSQVEYNIRNHFSSLCDNGGIPKKRFWESVKPFLNDKGSHGNENYTLLENGKLIEDPREISEIFNDHYINEIENITGKKQEGLHSDSLSNRN